MRRAMAIQLIINREWGLAKNENPNQGSFIIEELTDLVEEAVLAGVRAHRRARRRARARWRPATSAARSRKSRCSTRQRKHDGTLPIVGVNTFRNPHGARGAARAGAGALHRGGEAVAARAPGRLPGAPCSRSAGGARAPAAGGDRRRQRVRRADGRGARAARSARSPTRCSRSAGSTGATCRAVPGHEPPSQVAFADVADEQGRSPLSTCDCVTCIQTDAGSMPGSQARGWILCAGEDRREMRMSVWILN